jgi:hypothetical protein
MLLMCRVKPMGWGFSRINALEMGIERHLNYGKYLLGRI